MYKVQYEELSLSGDIECFFTTVVSLLQGRAGEKGGKEIAKSLKSNMEFGFWRPNQRRKKERYIFTVYFAR